MTKKQYFAAKSIYRHHQLDPIGEKKYVYEERVVLIQANDIDQAILKAEKEAKEYSDSGTEYLKYVTVFNLFEYILRNGSELYSEMRSSDLEPGKYIDEFYQTGFEHSCD